MNTTSNNMNTGNTVDSTDGRPREESASSNGLGNRLRGVVEVIHGVGENIRGTALGALDTMSKGGNTKNDEIARKGRLETERGLAHLRGSQPPSHGQSASFPSTNGNYASTNPGATGSGAGFQSNNPEATHGGYGQDPNYAAGQTRNTGATGAQYPLWGDSQPSGVTGSTAGTEIGRQPDSNYQQFSNTNQQGSAAAGTGGPDSAIYPSHHREDAVGKIPDSQLREVQQTAYDHPYNAAQNPTGPDFKQSQGAYENSYNPSSGPNAYGPQN